MKKVWLQVIPFLFILSLMCILPSGCLSKTPVAGYWQSTDYEQIYFEFVKDGTFIVDIGNEIFTGTYEVLSDNYLKVTISGPIWLFEPLFTKDIWKYKVSKNELTLTVEKKSTSLVKVENR